MHKYSTAVARIARILSEHGQDPCDYFVGAIAAELELTHGTWNVDSIDPNDFWPVVVAHVADEPIFCAFS